MGKRATLLFLHFIFILVTFLIALLTIFGFFASRVDPNLHSFPYLMGLILPALLLANLGLALYWAIRWRYWVWIPLASILLNFNFITAMVQLSFQKHVPADLKVASYNVRGFQHDDYVFTMDYIAQFMEEEKVDVICLQEFSDYPELPMDSILSFFHSYPYVSIKTTPTHNLGLAILSKYPITASDHVPFQASDNGMMWADIQVRNQTIRFFNNHLQTTNLNQTRGDLDKQMARGNIHGEAKAILKITDKLSKNFKLRANQANLVRSAIDTAPYPVIVCGDFNDTPASYTYHRVKGTLNDGFQTSGSGYGATFQQVWNLLRVDYIFYSDQLEGIRYYSPQREWSDHNPVIMEVKLK